MGVRCNDYPVPYGSEIPELKEVPEDWELLPDTTEGLFIVLKRKWNETAEARRDEYSGRFWAASTAIPSRDRASVYSATAGERSVPT